MRNDKTPGERKYDYETTCKRIPLKHFSSETAFRKWLIPELRNCKAEVFSIVGSKMQKGAYPDIILDHPKYHGYIEFKNESTILRADQIIQIKKLKLTGANAFVVRAPHFIENEYGDRLTTFLQSGLGLLLALEGLCETTPDMRY